MDIVGIIIAIAAALFVAFTIYSGIKRTRSGKSCGCSDCPAKQGGDCIGCSKYKEQKE